MSNLLPSSEREAVITLYRRRLWRVAAVLLLGVLGLILGVMGAFYGWVRWARVAAEAGLAGRTTSINESRITANDAALRRFSTRIKILDTALAASSTPELAFARVRSMRPAGVTISDLQYARTKGGATLELAGLARERQALLDFISLLQGDTFFAGVSSPISNLVRGQDFPFTLSLTIKS
jgi:Tfp pilus assembly protein PilN